MVLRLQNNLNLGPAQSAMAAAAELSIEAARAKARGMEGFASGLAGGVKTYVARKDQKRQEAESARRFDLSRADASAERAADNARADRALQQQADIHNASMNYKIWEDADKDIAAAVQSGDQAAFEAATKRKQAAGAGLQLAQQKPHVVAEAQRMGILPTPGGEKTPDQMYADFMAIDAKHTGAAAPPSTGPSVDDRQCKGYSCDVPKRGGAPSAATTSSTAPAAPAKPSDPQAALMDALTTEAAAQAAYDANKAILDNKNERSWERKETARAQEAILLGALTRARATAILVEKQVGAEVSRSADAAKATEAAVAKAREQVTDLIAWSRNPDGARQRFSPADLNNPEIRSRIAVEHKQQEDEHTAAAQARAAKAFTPEYRNELASRIESDPESGIADARDLSDDELYKEANRVDKRNESARRQGNTEGDDAFKRERFEYDKKRDAELDTLKKRDAARTRRDKLSKEAAKLRTTLAAPDYDGSDADWTRLGELTRDIEKIDAGLDTPEASAQSYPSWLPDEMKDRWDAMDDAEKQKAIKAQGA